MGKHLLRQDKECQNCGRTVEENYCPNCGQKNTETRQSFWHLVTHFAEDLTHYDSGFWKTIKYLLFRPGRLTKEYLAGKRQSYVPPVKLYIFISFLTFFIPAIVPDSEVNSDDSDIAEFTRKERLEVNPPKPYLDVEESVFFGNLSFDAGGPYIESPIAYRSVREMDSIESLKPDSLRLSGFERRLATNLIHMYKKNTPYEVGEKFWAAVPQNVPKAIFFYMPVFAFWLWLFHSKKRWYFFDHGIFTLHYFSFLLLTTTLLILLFNLAQALNSNTVGDIYTFVAISFLVWQIYYFSRAHRKMYHEKWLVNFLKSVALFFINFISILILLLLFLIYTYHNLH